MPLNLSWICSVLILQTDHLKPAAPQVEQGAEDDQWPSLDKNTRRELYAFVKENKEEELETFINERDTEGRREVGWSCHCSPPAQRANLLTVCLRSLCALLSCFR